MDISKMTKSELLAICAQKNIQKCKSKTKTELIALINEHSSNIELVVEDQDNDLDDYDDENINDMEELVTICEEPTNIPLNGEGSLNSVLEPKVASLEPKVDTLTVAETFVGCGGSHFGFKKSGYKSVFVNDIWIDAIKTLQQNDTDLQPNEVICDDIYKLDAQYFADRNICAGNVDVFIGGVVCKGFSLAGIRNPYDERNYLYLQQLRLVGIIRPKISIIENVPGMLNMKILSRNNNDAVKQLCTDLNDVCEKHKKVRGRLIAEKKKLGSSEATLGSSEATSGSSEATSGSSEATSGSSEATFGSSDNEALKTIIENTKAEMAALATLRKELELSLEDYKYSVVQHIEKIYGELGYDVYKKVLTCSDYGCFTNRQRLFIVAVRKDLGLTWEYPEPFTKDCRPTVKEAFDLLDYGGINDPAIDVDNRPMNHSESTVEKFKKIGAGGKSENGYFSRGTSSRLAFDKPAPTLVPGHSAFQIHPVHNRSITVREGATLTGFDTNFRFYGSHSSRCMQIGNAIPVKMAYTMAEQCKKVLNSKSKDSSDPLPLLMA